MVNYLQKSKQYKGFHYSVLPKESFDYLHKRTFEIFREIKAIFDQNKIPYMVCGGTLLGAATTGKFIPWDDDFDMCVFDEVHELRNRLGKTNKAVKAVIQGKPTLFLTGTPIMSNPEDIYGIVSMANEKYFGDYRSFSKEFLVRAMTSFGWDTIGAKNLDKFRLMV